MNPVQMAVSNIKYHIPAPILKDVFVNRFYDYRASPLTIEERIRRDVVLARVLPDCRVFNGTTAFISMAGVPFEAVSAREWVFTIPIEKTGGMSIISPLSAVVTMAGSFDASNLPGGVQSALAGGGIPSTCNSPMNNAIQGLIDSHSMIPRVTSARVTLVGENVVLVEDPPHASPSNLAIEVLLASDDHVNALRPRSITAFNKLVLLATKAHIYTTLVLEVDTARLIGGQDLGAYRDIIQGYESANEEYEEYQTEVMGKVFFLNDNKRTSRFIATMLGGVR